MRQINPKIKWIILLVVIFIVGTAVGFISGQLYQKEFGRRNMRHRIAPRERFLSNLEKNLNLTAEQSLKIRDILDEQRKQIEQETEPMRERMRLIREEVIKEIELILTPEQVEQFRVMNERMEREGRRRWGPNRRPYSRDTLNKKEK